MTYDSTLPPAGVAEVRIVAASPDVARRVAQALRDVFASTEQRSFPAGESATGTSLHLTVETAGRPKPVTGGSVPQAHPAPQENAVTGARRIWP